MLEGGCAASGGRGNRGRAACCERPGKVQATWAEAGMGGGATAAGRDWSRSSVGPGAARPCGGRGSPGAAGGPLFAALCLGRREGGRRRGRLPGLCSPRSPAGRGSVAALGSPCPSRSPCAAPPRAGRAGRAGFTGGREWPGVRGWRSGCLIPPWAADGRCWGRGFPSRRVLLSLAGVNREGPLGRGAGPRQESLLAK